MEKLNRLELIRACTEAYIEPTQEDIKLLEELRTIKAQVEYLLRKYSQATNNDFFLQLLWLRIFSAVKIPWLEGVKIMELSGNLESVRRVRQKIQNNEHRLLPTDPKVREARKRRSEIMRRIIKDV